MGVGQDWDPAGLGKGFAQGQVLGPFACTANAARGRAQPTV